MTHARLTPLAHSLPETVPFVGPETQERSRAAPFLARLGANESVFGASPKAVEALSQAGHWMYGDPENYDLRHALAAKLGCSAQNVVIGEGIDGLLGYLVRLCVGPGESVVTSDGAYPTFNYHVAGFGGRLHKVPFDPRDREDISALFAKAAEVDAKLVYLSNPDNPMGTYWSGADIVDALSHLPADTLLVLDEAYIETAPQGTAPQLPWDDPRLIRFRTFSKVYGLAGARIGYGIAHPTLISAFNKVRNHFGMARGAQAAALAALEDEDWLKHVVAQVDASRRQIMQIAQDTGLSSVPSATNFVAIDCGGDGQHAKRILDGLISQGIFVRMPAVAPQNRCIRVSCGSDEDLQHFATALKKVL